MKLHELREDVGYKPVELDEILKAMQPIANQKVVWRGMHGRRTVYSKVNNDRSGFRGAISPQANAVMKGLKVMHPAFGIYSREMAEFFGPASIMIPIPPYRALQSEVLKDMVHNSLIVGDALVDTYSERMDLEHSEIVFDIKEYYMLNIYYAIDHLWDPDGFADGRLYKSITKAIKGIKTYQNVIDILTKEQPK